MRGFLGALLLLSGCGAVAEASPVEHAGTQHSGEVPTPAELDQNQPSSQPDASAPPPHDAGVSNGGGGDAGAGDAGPALPPMPHQSFLVGYNQGWSAHSYGTDLTTKFDLTYLRTILDNVNLGGGHVVRIWLFEGLQGITLASSAPQSKAISAGMLANLETLLVEARARGIWVYLTALNGNDMPQAAGPTRDFYWNLVNNKYGEGDAFQTNVLAPVLAVMDRHKDMIYGLDLLNEIEAARKHLLWSDVTQGARDFMQRTAAFVHQKSPWLKVTTSAGFGGSQYDVSGGLFSGLGLDFYDLHVYADNGTWDGMTAVCARAQQDGVPIILGEVGQLTQSENDTLQAATLQTFLQNAKGSCFKGALAWRLDAAEPWYHFVRADGTFRPAAAVMQTFGAMP